MYQSSRGSVAEIENALQHVQHTTAIKNKVQPHDAFVRVLTAWKGALEAARVDSEVTQFCEEMTELSRRAGLLTLPNAYKTAKGEVLRILEKWKCLINMWPPKQTILHVGSVVVFK
jgi:hypothetical protein